MKIELYSIKDSLIGFSHPFPCHSEFDALRQFVASARASQANIVNTFPEHKELWRLGELDDQTGEIVNDCKFIARASTYIEVKHEEERSTGAEDENID